MHSCRSCRDTCKADESTMSNCADAASTETQPRCQLSAGLTVLQAGLLLVSMTHSMQQQQDWHVLSQLCQHVCRAHHACVVLQQANVLACAVLHMCAEYVLAALFLHVSWRCLSCTCADLHLHTPLLASACLHLCWHALCCGANTFTCSLPAFFHSHHHAGCCQVSLRAATNLSWCKTFFHSDSLVCTMAHGSLPACVLARMVLTVCWHVLSCRSPHWTCTAVHVC
jgi:hypothetical protein